MYWSWYVLDFCMYTTSFLSTSHKYLKIMRWCHARVATTVLYVHGFSRWITNTYHDEILPYGMMVIGMTCLSSVGRSKCIFKKAWLSFHSILANCCLCRFCEQQNTVTFYFGLLTQKRLPSSLFSTHSFTEKGAFFPQQQLLKEQYIPDVEEELDSTSSQGNAGSSRWFKCLPLSSQKKGLKMLTHTRQLRQCNVQGFLSMNVPFSKI